MVYGIILCVLLIIIFLFFINKNLNKMVFENFKIHHNKPRENVIENCKRNYGKLHIKDKNYCMKSAFVTDPSLLSGFCGGTINKKKLNPLYAIQHKNELYYGCVGSHKGGIRWETERRDKKFKLNSKVSNNLTLTNVYTSDLILFLTVDDTGTAKIGKKSFTHKSWTEFSIFTYSNVRYNDVVSLSLKNTGGQGGYCVAYIWNGQLYIMDINGFASSINNIEFNQTLNNVNILKSKYNSNIKNMPSFMYNWINLPTKNKTENITFNVGLTTNIVPYMSVLTVYLIINGTGNIMMNGKEVYNYTTANTVVNFDVDNIMWGDELEIKGTGNKLSKGTPILGIAYVYKGYLFVLENKSNQNNKNIIKTACEMKFKCNNWNKKYSDKNGKIVIPPIITGWIEAEKKINSFKFNLNIGV